MRCRIPLYGPMKSLSITMRPDTLDIVNDLRMKLSIKRREKISLSQMIDELTETQCKLQLDHLASLPGL